jgi:hypothetical protein
MKIYFSIHIMCKIIIKIFDKMFEFPNFVEKPKKKTKTPNPLFLKLIILLITILNLSISYSF